MNMDGDGWSEYQRMVNEFVKAQSEIVDLKTEIVRLCARIEQLENEKLNRG